MVQSYRNKTDIVIGIVAKDGKEFLFTEPVKSYHKPKPLPIYYGQKYKI